MLVTTTTGNQPISSEIRISWDPKDVMHRNQFIDQEMLYILCINCIDMYEYVYIKINSAYINNALCDPIDIIYCEKEHIVIPTVDQIHLHF